MLEVSRSTVRGSALLFTNMPIVYPPNGISEDRSALTSVDFSRQRYEDLPMTRQQTSCEVERQTSTVRVSLREGQHSFSVFRHGRVR